MVARIASHGRFVWTDCKDLNFPFLRSVSYPYFRDLHYFHDLHDRCEIGQSISNLPSTKTDAGRHSAGIALSFTIAGAIAGLAGGLYAIFNGFISADAVYWTASGDILIMTMLGGAGTLIGAETVSLVIYRGEPDEVVSLEVNEATQPSGA